MQAFTLFYIAPAALFLAMSLLRYISGGLPRLFASVPVLACYVCTAALLFFGGTCHRVAHVRLHGLEVDLVDRAGRDRVIPMGGAAQGQRPAAGIEIPGLPPEALLLQRSGGQLLIKPGPGYQRGILVQSGGQTVPLEPGGTPRLVPLEAGDEIHAPDSEGGEIIAFWRLGRERAELDVTASARWLGGDGTGLARVPGLPPQVLSLRAEASELVLRSGPGWMSGLGVQINGSRLPLRAGEELRAPWRAGLTTLALVRAEPLAGVFRLQESAPPLRAEAHLEWRSLLAEPVAFAFEMESARAYRVGGSMEDDLFIKGLPPAAMALTVSATGDLALELAKNGLKARNEGRLPGAFPQTGGVQKPLRLGGEGATFDGSLHLIGPAQPAADLPATVEAAEGDIDAPPAAAPVIRWRCAWQPALGTRWRIPNRTISLPLVSLPVDLLKRRPWEQRVFPLGQLSAREGTLRSALVYGEDHPALMNGASLLQLEPGLQIRRAGAALIPESQPIGLLKNDAEFKILQVLEETEGDRAASGLGSPLQPARTSTAQRVTVRRTFASVAMVFTEKGGKKQPVLRITHSKPQVRSVSMTDIKKDLAAMEAGQQGVKFGLNDRSGFSGLHHQVTFPLLTRAFDEANADVELLWSSFTVQDDFKHQTLKYEEPFQVGGSHRMSLSITPQTVPGWRIFWVLLAGLAATAVTWAHGAAFGWQALNFGVAFLTCSRVLFGQAALVNPPYDAEVISRAMPIVVLAPLVLGLGLFLLRGLLPGRIERLLRALEARLSYRWLAALALAFLLVRLALLAGLGAKEALSLGSLRLALSIFFVPASLLLFAQACHLLWREKQAAGGLLPRVVGRFALVTLWLFACQSATALMASDLGLFLYFMPVALVLSAIGLAACWEGLARSLRLGSEELRVQKPWLACLGGAGLVLPLLLIALVFTAPKAVLSAWPGLVEEMTSEEELVTDTTLLRLLQFADEDYLINLGTDTAERIAQDHAIMASYARRGLFGQGWLQVRVLPAKYVIALNDNVSCIYIFAQFGVIGALAVLTAYAAFTLSTLGAVGRGSSLTTWLAVLAGMSLTLVSLYMMAANYGLLPFTGRNMYLLGLNSISDVAESFALILLILLGTARAAPFSTAASQGGGILPDIIEGNSPGLR